MHSQLNNLGSTTIAKGNTHGNKGYGSPICLLLLLLTTAISFTCIFYVKTLAGLDSGTKPIKSKSTPHIRKQIESNEQRDLISSAVSADQGTFIVNFKVHSDAGIGFVHVKVHDEWAPLGAAR